MDKSKALHDAGITIGIAVTTVLTTVPDAALVVWQTAPHLFQAVVPEEYLPVVSGVITLLVAISRVIKAKKAKVEKNG